MATKKKRPTKADLLFALKALVGAYEAEAFEVKQSVYPGTGAYAATLRSVRLIAPAVIVRDAAWLAALDVLGGK